MRVVPLSALRRGPSRADPGPVTVALGLGSTCFRDPNGITEEDSLNPSTLRNRKLRQVYLTAWDSLREVLERDERCSAPYLAWVHADYERTARRVVVVGKETSGWGDRSRVLRMSAKDAVEDLQHKYRRFRLGTEYSGKQSYWVPAHELYRRLNPNGPELGFVALNVAKVDVGGKPPPREFREALTKPNLLQRELEILDPHVVVFHTGPRYDPWLQDEFGDLKIIGDRFYARLVGKCLPEHSFRTYHPRYLNYRSARKKVYDRILESVTHD